MKAYDDRRHAGRVLAGLLEVHQGALVLGIPRGGVVVAAVMAEALGGELDIAIARKVGSPMNPELAMGAVGVDGVALMDQEIVSAVGASPAEVDAEVERQTAEARRRLAVYRGDRPPLEVAGRTIIVADDGVATGATMKAVLAELGRQGPGHLICAVPCGPPSTLRDLRALAGDVVCPLQPPGFMAVGQWYRDFAQTTDDEVLELLGETGEGRPKPPRPSSRR